HSTKVDFETHANPVGEPEFLQIRPTRLCSQILICSCAHSYLRQTNAKTKKYCPPDCVESESGTITTFGDRSHIFASACVPTIAHCNLADCERLCEFDIYQFDCY